MDDKTIALMEKIASEAAQQAVDGTLISLGIDRNRPLEAQHDMLALRELRGLVDDPEFQSDLLYLRKFRKTLDSIQVRGVTAAVGMVCMSALALVVYTFKG